VGKNKPVDAGRTLEMYAGTIISAIILVLIVHKNCHEKGEYDNT
jgi:hypothetical protein